MLGAFPHQQTRRCTPNGPSITPSRLETPSVSNLFLSILFDSCTLFGLISSLQCSYTHQVKIQLFKSPNNPTTLATSKIQSCTWTMETLCLTSLNLGSISSPVGNLVTVKTNRSFIFLCCQGMGLLLQMLHLMVRLHHCLIRLHLHLPTLMSLAPSLNRLLLRPR